MNRSVLAVLAIAITSYTVVQAAPLPALNIDPTKISVSGLSSGGFMANQLGYAHTTAGRAHLSGGYALANGSNQNMGLWNVFITTTLKQTGPNYYVIGTCP